MAGAGLLALIDDIAGAAAKLAASADDVAILAAQAGKKTAGVLGDDLALNANQLVGIDPKRELPIVWKVAVGSLKNKAILVPAALAISAVAPWAIVPLLMFGGAFLCFEGVEKVLHAVLHPKEHAEEVAREKTSAPVDYVALEQAKVSGAIRTDFILSAEIVAITLGYVAKEDLLTRIVVLVAIALIMTAGVYGIVAAIVKLDDVGLVLSKQKATRVLGRFLLKVTPYLLRGLSVAGTVAMFLVGGGIVLHGIHPVEAWLDELAERLGGHGPFGKLINAVFSALAGVIVGVAVIPLFKGLEKLAGLIRKKQPA